MDSERLARYLVQEASPEDRQAVERWMRAQPENTAEVERLRAALDAVGAPEGGWDVDRAWAATQDRVARGAQEPTRLVRGWPALAAAAVLALGLALVWWRTTASPRLTAARATTLTNTTTAPLRTTLSDSTTVVLAPGGILSLAPGFGRRERAVQLAGEAWFEVRHDGARPFRVRAAGTLTEDLGTKFSVRVDGGTVRVIVSEGRVALRREREPRSAAIELAPSQMAVVEPGGVSVRRAPVQWRPQGLVFEDVPLGDVARELGRWFGVPVVVGDSGLAGRPLTATIGWTSLDNALEVVELTMHVKRVTSRDTIRLVPAERR